MKIYQKVLDRHGSTHQITLLIEEMAELTKELCKLLNSRYNNQAQLVQLESNICSEISDVSIVLEQIKLIYPEWKQHEERKLKRLEELVK